MAPPPPAEPPRAAIQGRAAPCPAPHRPAPLRTAPPARPRAPSAVKSFKRHGRAGAPRHAGAWSPRPPPAPRGEPSAGLQPPQCTARGGGRPSHPRRPEGAEQPLAGAGRQSPGSSGDPRNGSSRAGVPLTMRLGEHSGPHWSWRQPQEAGDGGHLACRQGENQEPNHIAAPRLR